MRRFLYFGPERNIAVKSACERVSGNTLRWIYRLEIANGGKYSSHSQ